MSNPTGKTHNLSSLADLLKLSKEEMERLIPDLLMWHALSIELAELAECTPEQLSQGMEWKDDGEKHVTHINLNLCEYGVVDLLKPETWPSQGAQK